MSQNSRIQQIGMLTVAGAVVSKRLVVDNEVNRIGVIGHRNINEKRVSGLVTILEGTTGRILHEIPLGFALSLWAYNLQRHHLYVNQSNEPVYTGSVENEPPGYITQLDLINGQVIHTYSIGPRLGKLFHCAPQKILYFTYYHVASASYMVGAIDDDTQNIRDIAALSWYPETLSYIAETEDILLIGSKNIATLNRQGTITPVYQLSPPDGEITYRDKVGNMLYFTSINLGDTFFALSLPDYRYHKVLETPNSYFQWIDPTRAIAYFLTRDPVEPKLSQCLLTDIGVPQVRPIANLTRFPGYNDVMLFDSTSQRWYFDSTMSDAAGERRFQLTVIDVPDLLTNPMQAVMTFPLGEIVMAIDWWQPQHIIAVLTSGYHHAHIILFAITPLHNV